MSDKLEHEHNKTLLREYGEKLKACEAQRYKLRDQLEDAQKDLDDARNGWEAAAELVRELEKQRDELLEALKAIRPYVNAGEALIADAAIAKVEASK